jgi:YqaJ-like viral recombinase domain
MMQIITCEQGTPEWHAARLGIPTASRFATVMAKGKSGGDSVTRKEYMQKLAGEIITGRPMENYRNEAMERGHEQEAEARSLYAYTFNVTPELVGFVRNGQAGCSPDALIGNDGVLEIKSKAAHVLIELNERKMRGDFPAEHLAQCQGNLWITEREWIDIAAYCPGMILYQVRAYRAEPYIKTLASEVDRFNAELHEMVERNRALREIAA